MRPYCSIQREYDSLVFLQMGEFWILYSILSIRIQGCIRTYGDSPIHNLGATKRNLLPATVRYGAFPCYDLYFKITVPTDPFLSGNPCFRCSATRKRGTETCVQFYLVRLPDGYLDCKDAEIRHKRHIGDNALLRTAFGLSTHTWAA
jgi:hypothetical protein